MMFSTEGELHPHPRQTSRKSSCRVRRYPSMTRSYCENSQDMHWFDSLCDQLSCLRRQEEKYYICPDYLSLEPCANEDVCDVDNNKLLSSISFVEECARLVTDLSLQTPPPPCSPSPITCPTTRVVNKVPSATHDMLREKVERDEITMSTSSSSLTSSPCVVTSFMKGIAAEQITAGLSVLDREAVVFWRQEMFDWSILVVENFGINREVVAVAFNILDRYVAKVVTDISRPVMTREDFQLFCMTSLYIAVKTLEAYPLKLSIEFLVDMSREYYTKEFVERTERDILHELGWLINPPTGYEYCTIYLSMLSPSMDVIDSLISMKAACQSLIEIATSDTFFLSKKSSLVGLASVLLAAKLEGISDCAVDDFVMHIAGMFTADEHRELNECIGRLKVLYFV